jgi:hypothetical protein
MGTSEGKPESSARIQIVVALIGLVGVIAAALIANWNGLFGKSTSTATTVSSSSAPSSTSSSPPAKKPARAVFSSGELMVRGTWRCDLDAGAETQSGGDFWWQLETSTKRELTPEDGATFYVVGVRDFDSLAFEELQHFSYSAKAIDGSDVKGQNDIPKGTVVAYRTKQGRLGKFVVDSYGVDLSIRWTTYEK